MVIIFGFYFFHQQATSTATATVKQSVRLYANEAANAVAETENAGKYETLEPGANLTDRPMATCCHRFLAISDTNVSFAGGNRQSPSRSRADRRWQSIINISITSQSSG